MASRTEGESGYITITPMKENYMFYEHCVMLEDIENGKIEKVRQWLKKGFSPRCRESGYSWAGLDGVETAIWYKQPEILELLLMEGDGEPPAKLPGWFSRETDPEVQKKIEAIIQRYYDTQKKGKNP